MNLSLFPDNGSLTRQYHQHEARGRRVPQVTLWIPAPFTPLLPRSAFPLLPHSASPLIPRSACSSPAPLLSPSDSQFPRRDPGTARRVGRERRRVRPPGCRGRVFIIHYSFASCPSPVARRPPPHSPLPVVAAAC